MPLVIKGIPAEPTEVDRRERDEKVANERGLTAYTGWLAIVTFGLVIVGSFQLGLFWWQLRLIRESLVDTKKAANAAHKSAEVAERTVAMMKDTAERQLRAYAMVTRVEIVKVHPNKHREFVKEWIHITIKNFGQIPASNVTYWVAIYPKEYPLQTEPGVLDPLVQTFGPIAPGDTFMIRTEIPLMNADALADGHTALYSHGEVQYHDGFTPNRRTMFRHMRQGGDNWSQNGDMEVCEFGNDAT